MTGFQLVLYFKGNDSELKKRNKTQKQRRKLFHQWLETYRIQLNFILSLCHFYSLCENKLFFTKLWNFLCIVCLSLAEQMSRREKNCSQNKICSSLSISATMNNVNSGFLCIEEYKLLLAKQCFQNVQHFSSFFLLLFLSHKIVLALPHFPRNFRSMCVCLFWNSVWSVRHAHSMQMKFKLTRRKEQQQKKKCKTKNLLQFEECHQPTA